MTSGRSYGDLARPGEAVSLLDARRKMAKKKRGAGEDEFTWSDEKLAKGGLLRKGGKPGHHAFKSKKRFKRR